MANPLLLLWGAIKTATIFGAGAGMCYNSGSSGNTFIGRYAAKCQTGGNYNIAIGCNAQLESSTGSNQLVIGYGSDYWLRGDSSYNIRPGAGIIDWDGNTGSSGQVLSSTGSVVKWTASGGGGVGGTSNGMLSTSQNGTTAWYTGISVVSCKGINKWIFFKNWF